MKAFHSGHCWCQTPLLAHGGTDVVVGCFHLSIDSSGSFFLLGRGGFDWIGLAIPHARAHACFPYFWRGIGGSGGAAGEGKEGREKEKLWTAVLYYYYQRTYRYAELIRLHHHY